MKSGVKTIRTIGPLPDYPLQTLQEVVREVALPQDHHLIEQMAHFNRERIPERQPHAKGSGACGYFEVTQDLSAYPKAAMFQPGTKADRDRSQADLASVHQVGMESNGIRK